MTARCFDTLHVRCARALGHPGVHRSGERFWNSRDLPLPAWRVAAEKARQEQGWVAVKSLDR